MDSLYSRSVTDLPRGTFRVHGDTVEIRLAFTKKSHCVWFSGATRSNPYRPCIPSTAYRAWITRFIPDIPGQSVCHHARAAQNAALARIGMDLESRINDFTVEDKLLEAQRIRERVTYDMEMIREIGHCSGIENYSRYFDGRSPGDRPFCLLDYFPKDFLTIIDESHVTVPQIRAMYGGDVSRKNNLVDYGFRLPAALDNRPLRFDEFESMIPQTIYVSATPADYELAQAEGVVVEQIIRPTGLLDPKIEVRASLNQIDDLMNEIQERVEKRARSRHHSHQKDGGGA